MYVPYIHFLFGLTRAAGWGHCGATGGGGGAAPDPKTKVTNMYVNIYESIENLINTGI